MSGFSAQKSIARGHALSLFDTGVISSCESKEGRECYQMERKDAVLVYLGYINAK